jgi:hypothetical protein
MIRGAEEHTVGRRPALGSARPGHQDGARQPASIGLPADSFDLVHERTLLPSVYHSRGARRRDDPACPARRRGRAPEPDIAAWAIGPPHPRSELLRTKLFDVYPRSGRDFHTVRRAARLLRRRPAQVRIIARVTAPGEYFQTFLPTLPPSRGRRSRPRSPDAQQARLHHHRARRAPRQNPARWPCLSAIWQARGRKP